MIVALLLFAGISAVASGSEHEAPEAAAAPEQVEGAQPPGVELTRAGGWYTCSVKRTGAGWGSIFLRLECPGIPERWFKARPDQPNEMLAVGLSALSAGKQVQVHLAGTDQYSLVNACYVIQ